jgi:hypothetical protein
VRQVDVFEGSCIFLGGPNWSPGCGDCSVSPQAPAADIADHETDHLCRRATRTRDDLSLRHRQSVVDETADHCAIESLSKDRQLLRDAVQKARE